MSEFESKYPPPESKYDIASENSPPNQFSIQICIESIKTGDTNTLSKMIRNNGTAICSYAALHGKFKVLKWARVRKCKWCEDTCAYAAASGHLKNIEMAPTQWVP